MKPISAVIITKNEERNIDRCLDSLADWVSEIIVLDSGSTDRTKEICLKYKQVKFIEHPWRGYGPTKNIANELASSAYILSLDADEAISPELRKSIEDLKDPLRGAYSFSRRTNYCGQWIRHSGWYPDKKIRLFPKKQTHWNEDPVHEDLVLPAKTRVQELRGDILHYSYYTIREHLQRTHRYSELAAQRIANSSQSLLQLRSIVNPPLRFLRHYLLKRGFLDGYFGLVISGMASLEVYLKYSTAARLRRQKNISTELPKPVDETLQTPMKENEE
jgi:glycosyltransferase involved in cell wall biosynthesis